MKRILGGVAALGLVLGVGFASAQDAKPMTYKGIVVDNKCSMSAGKRKTEDQLAGHKAACAITCATGGEKLVLVAGDKAYTLDDKGQTLAKEYLEKNKDKAMATKVAVEGTVKGDVLMATSIKAQEEPKS